MNRNYFSLVVLVLSLCLRSYALDAVIYLTVHNLGCRQSNSTYNGYIPNYGFSEGDRVELILAGPNGQIDPPQASGLPGGDDQLAVNPGLPFAMNPVSFTQVANTFYSPEAIFIENIGFGPEPALHTGSKFYLRAWNGPTPATSTMYYNSARLWQDYPLGIESCNVDSAVRTIRQPFTIPALVTYAATLDGGHSFATPLSPPVVVAYVDSAQTKLYWHSVPAATLYRIEYSPDNTNWSPLATTPDTLYPLANEPGLYVLRLYRVFAIQ